MRVRHPVRFGLLVACLGAGTALAGDGTAAADAVNAALAEAAPAKLSVAETFAQTGRWVHSNEAIGFEAPTGASHSINVGNHGAITIAFSGPAEIAGGAIVLMPSDGGNGRVEWACTSSDLPADAVPQGCE
jgi:hypothetical protein